MDIYTTFSDVDIDAQNIDKAYQLLCDWDSGCNCGWTLEGLDVGFEARSFKAKGKSFPYVLKWYGFDFAKDKNGNIGGLSYIADYSETIEEILKAIAPTVNDGYIELEDMKHLKAWRYVFQDGKLRIYDGVFEPKWELRQPA